MNLLRTLKARLLRSVYKGAYPNGHFYSPVPDPKILEKEADTVFRRQRAVYDIELRREAQFDFFRNSLAYYKRYPFSKRKTSPYRYYYENPFFNLTDSLTLFFVLNHYKPSNIVEVGSGFSSAMMLDTFEFELAYRPRMTFIDPFTQRLKELLKAEDYSNCTILDSVVQRVDLDVFRKLQRGDLLFIDSSHISKAGSDLNFLMFEVLPVLNKGVVIHFHDVCYPFEYPRDWIKSGIFWNEAYLLRAFLMNNSDYEVLVFNDYITDQFRPWFELNMPLFTSGGSLYLIKK